MNLSTASPPGGQNFVPYAAEPEKPSRLQSALVAMLILSALVNYIDRQATSVVAPLLKADFHLTDEQWGWANSVFALTYVFTSALGGLWIDRVGIRKGLMIATIVWSVAAAGHSLANGFVALCCWRAALAVGEGPGGASLLKGVRMLLPPRLQDSGVSWIGAGTLLGAIVAPIFIAPMADAIGWRAAFVVTAVLGGLWVIPWAILARRRGAGMDAHPPTADSPQHKPRLDPRSFSIWATALAIFFTIPPSVFTLSFLSIYLNSTFGIPVKQLAGLQWQPFLAMDLGQLAGGAVLFHLYQRKWSPLRARRMVMVAGFIGSTTMLMMTRADSLGGAMFWLNLSRFSFQFAYVALLAYGMSCAPPEQAGALNGFMNATFGFCNFVFNPVIGKLADAFHSNYGAVLTLVSLAPLVGLALWLMLSSLGQRQEAARAAALAT
jgi:ACS family hexuronate transporter-like MFS transporter